MRAVGPKLIVIAAVVASIVGTPAGAAAESTGGQDFGQDVSTCARTMGFDSMHNPGLHHGFAGWDAMHEC
jgi:hypothetical protein